MVKIKIKIDKDILQRSAHCEENNAGSNCAFALGVRDLLPDAIVQNYYIVPSLKKIEEYAIKNGQNPENMYISEALENNLLFNITPQMSAFISLFDELTPEQRVKLPEQEFELEIPDWVIEHINIDDVKRIIENSSYLELV